MDIIKVKSALEELKEFKTKGGITPEKLANLLNNMVDALVNYSDQMLTLEVNVAENKKKFLDTEDFTKVWEKMSQNEMVRFCIIISYSSGLRNFFYPTCVKPSYISIHAKSGSCELHVNSDGSFTTSGTSLW